MCKVGSSALQHRRKTNEPDSREKIAALLVTGLGSPYVYETSRLAQFLDNRLTDGGDAAIHTRRPLFIPTKIPGANLSQTLS
jgi:hypothetical protein